MYVYIYIYTYTHIGASINLARNLIGVLRAVCQDGLELAFEYRGLLIGNDSALSALKRNPCQLFPNKPRSSIIDRLHCLL